jgi:hypothetical protein
MSLNLCFEPSKCNANAMPCSLPPRYHPPTLKPRRTRDTKENTKGNFHHRVSEAQRSILSLLRNKRGFQAPPKLCLESPGISGARPGARGARSINEYDLLRCSTMVFDLTPIYYDGTRFLSEPQIFTDGTQMGAPPGPGSSSGCQRAFANFPCGRLAVVAGMTVARAGKGR